MTSSQSGAARMLYPVAKSLVLETASDADLIAAWHSHASQISYHNADDHGGEWRLVPPIAECARKIEVAIRDRGLDRPTGVYLMTDNDRIDWETGEWSPGWTYKKALAK